jgi:autotransporter-associated beta strand protein
MSLNDHNPDPEQIDAYVAGGLAGAERLAFESHLRDCDACRVAVDAARADDRSLRDLFAGARPAAGFEDRLIRAVRATDAQPRRRLRLPLPVRRAAAVAAAVMLVGSVGFVGQSIIQGTPPAWINRYLSLNTGTGYAFNDGRGPAEDSRAMRASASRETTVNGLVADARQYVERGKFREGLAVVDHIEALDPANEYAKSVRNLLEDKAVTQEPRQYREEFNRQSSQQPNKTEEQRIPYGDTLRYPDNWSYFSQMQDQKTNSWGTGQPADKSSTSPPLDPTDSVSLPKDDVGVTAGKSKPVEHGLEANTAVAVARSSFKPYELYFHGGDSDSDGKALTKTGNGTLGIRGTNTFTGGTTVHGGTLSLGDQNQRYQVQDLSFKSADYTNTPNLDITQTGGQQGGRGEASTDAPPAPPPQIALQSNQGQFGSFAHAADHSSPTTAPVDTRKIIRNGTMEFEVDSFDTAAAKITQIVSETGGYVGTTDSTKLPNGKVKGTITLRVPPERLDVLVLSLRALGDLKSQQITAQDITKQYTDLQSQLTAARAMESRLLELIKSGNGAIKDLLAAEKELGVWREKIEQTEGEIRYYNSLVSMSTLTITLYERDIKTPAAVVETETADAGIEADDVEKARTDAIKAIDDAKGRVVEAELKRFDAGQLAARIVAEVPPDVAGSTIDRLKQLGRVARLEVHRQQTTAEGAEPTTTTASAPGAPSPRVDRRPTRLLVSIYNLANVAPRRTTNLTLAAADVESAYTALLDQAKATSGERVVTSSLDRGDPAKASGSIVLELPPDKLDAALTSIRSQGDVLKRAVVENADAQNTTDAKHGLTIQLVSLASVQPRETIQQVIAAADVPSAYHAILDAANAAHARVRTAQLNEQDRQNVNGTIDIEVQRAESAGVDKAITSSGEVVARAGARSADAENTTDSKVLMQMKVVAADRLPPRESHHVEIEVTDASKAAGDAQTIATTVGGMVADVQVTRDRNGRQSAHVVLDVPLAKAGEVLNQVRGEGTVRAIDSSRDTRAPAGALAHARIDCTFATADALVADQTGLWPTVRNGLGTSVMGLLLSVKLVVIGLCLVLPWALVLWIAWRLWRRRKAPSLSQPT